MHNLFKRLLVHFAYVHESNFSCEMRWEITAMFLCYWPCIIQIHSIYGVYNTDLVSYFTSSLKKLLKTHNVLLN